MRAGGESALLLRMRKVDMQRGSLQSQERTRVDWERVEELVAADSSAATLASKSATDAWAAATAA